MMEDSDRIWNRVAAQVNAYRREHVTKATSVASRVVTSQAATRVDSKKHHDCLVARHDIPVAFFHAAGLDRIVVLQRDGPSAWDGEH